MLSEIASNYKFHRKKQEHKNLIQLHQRTVSDLAGYGLVESASSSLVSRLNLKDSINATPLFGQIC